MLNAFHSYDTQSTQNRKASLRLVASTDAAIKVAEAPGTPSERDVAVLFPRARKSTKNKPAFIYFTANKTRPSAGRSCTTQTRTLQLKPVPPPSKTKGSPTRHNKTLHYLRIMRW